MGSPDGEGAHYTCGQNGVNTVRASPYLASVTRAKRRFPTW